VANAYVCDACGVTMTNPYKVNMKEFYVGCDFEYVGVFPIDCTRKVKVHLCEECYKGLKMIARNLEGKHGN
jgi:hypothetical protein